MSSHLQFLILVAIFNLSLSFFVYLRNPKSWVNKSFALFAGTLSFWTISVSMLLTQKTLFWSDLTLLFGNITGVSSFILFSKHFPEGQKINKKFLIYFFILPILLFIILLPFKPFVSGIIVENDQIKPVIAPFYPLLMGWSIFGALYGSYILLKKYRNSWGRPKSQLKYLFWGFFSFLTIVTITAVILPAFEIGEAAFFSPAASLILVGTTSYAILKHRFLDIRFIVARSVAYALLILFIAIAYMAVLFTIAFLLNSPTQSTPTTSEIIVPAILSIFFAISFQPLRRFFEKYTDKIFYKDHYDANTLLWNLSRTMASTLYLSELCEKIINELLSSMKINYGAIVLVRKQTIIWVGSAGDTKNRPLKGQDIYEIIHDAAKAKDHDERLLIFEEMHESKNKQIMRDHDITVVLPLIVRKEVIGGLLLGQKSSGEIYSSEDIDLLKIVAPEIAVAVRNALSFDEIKKFNITLEQEIKHATERLRKANKRLKELDSLKDEFVSIASHELRTPMTAIKSYLWMALNQPTQEIKPQLKKYLDISYNSTERLIRLVNDMLTVSRIERNKIELKKVDVDMYEVAQLVYDELKISAEEKHIDFTLQREKNEKYMVKGDKDKLREVLQNLVGNALKFTPEKGKIEILLQKKNNTVHIAVKDTASGIPKEAQKQLFQKFSKIEYSYAKHSSQPGTGLGLYISKQIVSLHNGDIEVQSEVGVGSTFTVILPLMKGGMET